VETTSDYTYLGIVLAASGKFRKHTMYAKQKARKAIGVIKQILRKGKTSQWETICKLFDSMVTSVLLYGAEVFSLSYLEEIEKIQTLFFRSILGVGHGVRGGLIRLETGRGKLSHAIFRRLINFIRRISKMADDRYPKIVLEALFQADLKAPNLEYNWVTQFKGLVRHFNLHPDTSLQWSRNMESRHIQNVLQQQEIANVKKEEETRFYDSYSSQSQTPGKPAAYLTLNIALWEKRLIAAARLKSRIVTSRDGLHVFTHQKSTCCRAEDEDSLTHILENCLTQPRTPIIQPIDPRSREEAQVMTLRILTRLKARCAPRHT